MLVLRKYIQVYPCNVRTRLQILKGLYIAKQRTAFSLQEEKGQCVVS